MSNTKKGFMKAGAIISIVLAVFFALGALIMFGVKSLLTDESLTALCRDVVVEGFEMDPDYKKVTEGDTFYFEYVGTDIDMKGTKITQEDLDNAIKLVVNTVKVVFNIGGVILLVYAVVNMTFGIMVLGDANKGRNRTGNIIALLVFSVLSGNAITMAFMIVSLCLKNKPEELNREASTIEA